ncbi:MAG: tRNA lysidine(34) synthetase TilS [Acidobacteriota bacterium]
MSHRPPSPSSATGPRLSALADEVMSSAAFREDERLLVGCSGGPDSTALVVLLDEARRSRGLELAIGHVHHGLRGEDADAEREHVAALAADLGLPFHEQRVDVVIEKQRRRRGWQDAAREARHRALDELREDAGADVIALAHTLDDQAETLLLRLLRGTGTAGLGAMRTRRGRIARPLLGVSRDRLLDYLLEGGVSWHSDGSNWSSGSRRGLVRELLERSTELFDEGLAHQLARTAGLLAEDDALLESLVDERWTQTAGTASDAPGAAGLALASRLPVDVVTWPRPLARRAVRRFLTSAPGFEDPPAAEAVQRVLDAAGSASVGPVELEGRRVRREGRWLTLGPAPPMPPPPTAQALPIPGECVFAGGRLVVRQATEPEAREGVQDPDHRRVAVDRDRMPRVLEVRPWSPGDRYQPAGHRFSRKVSRFLQDRKVPAIRRRGWPIVQVPGEHESLVWVPGWAPSPSRVVQEGTREVLILEWFPSPSPES